MSCATFKAAILRRPLNASPAMPKIYGSRGQTAVFRPRRINPCVNLCIKLTENASDASVFSVSLKRSFLTQVYPQIYFHSVPADKSRIPGIGKYCNTATAVSAVGFELDTNTNFEVKRISHKRRKCSGFILTATKVRFCITDTVHFDWNQCSNCRNQCSNYWNQCLFILEYARSKKLVFLTNNIQLLAFSIAELYKSRWQVELFFKWIKQHLCIKSFYGVSEYALKSQLWIAVSVYVLCAIIKKRLHLEQTHYTILQTLSLTLFEKTPLFQLLSETYYTTEPTESSNQMILFN